MTVRRSLVSSDVGALVSVLTVDVAWEVPIQIIPAASDTRAASFRNVSVTVLVRLLE